MKNPDDWIDMQSVLLPSPLHQRAIGNQIHICIQPVVGFNPARQIGTKNLFEFYHMHLIELNQIQINVVVSYLNFMRTLKTTM